ncbi:MAG TPA: hypothetical protein VFQ61_05215 [Polyangiaceae bacterium]|nr:hypothetical protein [Polyangiaceae bacterium]
MLARSGEAPAPDVSLGPAALPSSISSGVSSLPALALSQSGPLSFESSSPDGRWVVVCQAREDTNGDSKLEVKVQPNGDLRGDALRRYLVLASGTELAIEDAWLSSPAGNHLIVKRAGHVELLDLERGSSLELEPLAADLRREPSAREGHRSLALTSDSLLYVKLAGSSSALIERGLKEGSERVLWQGPESVVRFTLEGGGRYVVLWVPGRDVNGNGRFDWPFKPTLDAKPCRGSVPRFVSSEIGPDAQSAIVIDRYRSETMRFDDLAVVLADGVVRRDPEGALFLQRLGERASQLADKDCAARVLWSERTDQSLLFGCVLPKKPTRLGVEAYTRGRRQSLDLDVAWLGLDEPPAREPTRLVSLYPGADTILFDTEKQTLHRLNAGDGVLGTWGPHALVRRGRTLLIFDAEAHREALLPGSLESFGSVFVTGSLVYASPLLVDVAQGRVLGQIAARPLALTRGGQLLIPQIPATDEHLAEGPLAWKNAE